MTNKEAIQELKSDIEWSKLNLYPYISQRKVKALQMAIKALEQEPCEDCISKQAVLEIQAKYAEYMGATKFWQMRDDIKALPPVTPKKIGQWIKHDIDGGVYYDCSLCACIAPCIETADALLWKLSNYCPDCGAKMQSVAIIKQEYKTEFGLE